MLNKSKNSDYAAAIKISQSFLSIIGIWPICQDGSFVGRQLNKLNIVFCYLIIIFEIIPCVMFAFLEEPDQAKRILWYGPITFATMGLVLLNFLTFERESVMKCYDHIEKDWRDSTDSPSIFIIMKKNAKFGRMMIVACAMFFYGGAIFYHAIMPMITKKSYMSNSPNTSTKPLAYAVYTKVINIDESPTYEIIYALQVYGGFIISTTTIGVCSIAAIFISHMCGQLEIIMSELYDLIDKENIKMIHINKKFSALINRHVRALSFAENVERILSPLCLVEFVGNTLCLCMAGYCIIMAWQSHQKMTVWIYFTVFTAFALNIFILCLIGEIYTGQFKKIGNASYSIDWYRMSGKKPLDLILIILVANVPVKLTAGGMIDLSLTSFSSVMKTAVAYLNLLRQVTS